MTYKIASITWTIYSRQIENKKNKRNKSKQENQQALRQNATIVQSLSCPTMGIYLTKLAVRHTSHSSHKFSNHPLHKSLCGLNLLNNSLNSSILSCKLYRHTVRSNWCSHREWHLFRWVLLASPRITSWTIKVCILTNNLYSLLDSRLTSDNKLLSQYQFSHNSPQ